MSSVRIPLFVILLAVCLDRAAGSDGPDYPCYRNADGSGSGSAYDGRLITEIGQRRLLWESEEQRLASSYSFIIGGAGGPVIADGRVYVYYSFPSDELNQDYFDQKAKGRDLGKHAKTHEPLAAAMGFTSIADYIRTKCALNSDDIVLCCDLETGKTLWKRVYEKSAVNRSTSSRGILKWNKTGPHIIPAVAYGKVCTMLDRGAIVCLDAETGDELWRKGRIGRVDPHVKKDADGDKIRYGSQNKGVMLFGGGCFVCLRGDDLVGYRQEDGTEAWRVEGVGGGRGGCVVRTELDGRELAVGPSGAVVDLAAGKMLYSCDALGGCFPAISQEGIAVFGGYNSDRSRDADKRKAGLQAYQLGPDGAKKLWELDRELVSRDLALVIIGDRVLGKVGSPNRGQSRFISVDLATGTDIRFTEDFRSDGAGGSIGVGGQLVFYDKNLIVADPDGYRRDPASGLINDNDPDWCSSHTAAAVGPYLVVRGQYSLKCFDLRAR